MALKDWIEPIAAGVGAIGGAASTGLGNKKAWKHTKELFDMTNAYNTPLAQVKRMKEAGLNPAMMYDGSPVNTASQPNAPKVETYKPPENLLSDVMLKMAQGRLAAAQTPTTAVNINLGDANVLNKQADTTLKEAQTELGKQMASKAVTETSKIQQNYNLDRELFDTNVQYRKEQLKKLATDTNIAKQQLSTLPAETQAKIEQIKQSAAESAARTKNIKNQDWIFENEKALRELNINPSGGLIDTIIKYIVGSVIGAAKYGSE